MPWRWRRSATTSASTTPIPKGGGRGPRGGAGAGPAVIIIHEMPGLHPLVIRFADRDAAEGMTVFLPSLFGDPGRPVTGPYALGEMLKGICIRREFFVWSADKSSPIVDWLRALAATVHSECGGRGVGAVGMCFTGNFALAMMTEPSVVAPVLSQPSMPIPAGSAARSAGLGVTLHRSGLRQTPVRRGGPVTMIGLRFYGDSLRARRPLRDP